MSNSITKAIEEIKKYIRGNILRNAIIFAAGDDMLFKGAFNEAILYTMQEIYHKHTVGMTCSIGYGKTLLEAYLALKLAKAERGKNRVVGIELV